MTKTEKIAKAVKLIEDEIFCSVLDFENHSCFSDKKIECTDDSDEDEFYFRIEFKADEREIEFSLSVNIKRERFKINTYEDVFEDFSPFNFTVSEFWRVLFFQAVDK